jgi:ribosomal peptide maturation radical SAM protein 1
MKVALCVMPYHSAQYGSIQCGLLKRWLDGHGIPADVHYLNLRFARRLGLPYYEAMAHADRLLPEWSFGQELHGRPPAALREVRVQLGKLKARSGFDPKLYARLLDEVEPFLEECLGAADWGGYGLIGFSSVFQNQLASLALARRLKRAHPAVPIVFGGPNVEGEMGAELLRAFPFVDYVVDGEGERALLGLCRSLGTPGAGPVPGVRRRQDAAFERPAPVPMDELPVPDYDDYFAAVRATGLEGRVDPHLYFESSRGCWWGERSHCTFCGLNPDTIAYRSKSAERLLSEIEQLARRHQVCQLDATDNILDLRYLDTLFPRLKELIRRDGLSLHLFYETKANLRRAQVLALREGGVARVQPGIESLDSELLAGMRKGVTALQNVQLLRACREFGMDADWILLYGFPGEGPRHHERMRRLLPRLTHLQPPGLVQRWMLDRFSPFFRTPAEWGITVKGPRPADRLLYPPPADAAKLAYRFEYDCPGAPRDGGPELEALKELVRLWQERLAESTFFHYMKGPGFVRLYDHRLRRAEDRQPSFRSLVLEGWKAELYCHAFDARTEGELRAFCGREELAPVLDAWDRDGLILRENGRVLSLALPMPPDATRFLERVQLLWSVSTEELCAARS